MGAVGFAAALLLAAIFAWAAVSKLVDRNTVVADFGDMGLPVPALMLALVVGAEFATTALLVAQPVAGAVVALLLLGAFSMMLVSIVRSGRQVRCGCFGANHREPVSMLEVVRNAGLGVIALLALTADQAAGITLPAVMVVTLTALLLLVAVSLVGLSRTSGSLIRIELAGEIPDLTAAKGDTS